MVLVVECPAHVGLDDSGSREGIVVGHLIKRTGLMLSNDGFGLLSLI